MTDDDFFPNVIDACRGLLKEHDQFPPVAFVRSRDRPDAMILLLDDMMPMRVEALTYIIKAFNATRLCFAYDGYVTMYSDDSCPECLGEDEECETCRGMGRAQTPEGKRDGIVIIDLATPSTPMRITNILYTRVEGRVLMDSPSDPIEINADTTAYMTEYPCISTTS